MRIVVRAILCVGQHARFVGRQPDAGGYSNSIRTCKAAGSAGWIHCLQKMLTSHTWQHPQSRSSSATETPSEYKRLVVTLLGSCVSAVMILITSPGRSDADV
jgi:hypothetical protein